VAVIAGSHACVLVLTGGHTMDQERSVLKSDWEPEAEPEKYKFPDMGQVQPHEVVDREQLLRDPDYSGSGREVAVQDIHVWYQSIRFVNRRTWQVLDPTPRIQMNFNLRGTTTYYSDKLRNVFVRFHEGQHNLMLIPQGEFQMQCAGGEQSELFSLSLRTDFFFSLLPVTHRLCQHFRMGIKYQLPAFMSTRNLPVTGRMEHILFEIIHCKYTGHHKSLFVEAKTIELLLLQMEQYEYLPLPDILSGITSGHEQQMQDVKRLLDENLYQQWSLKELARQVGSNEFNLKKYFKEIFGETVFGYLHQKRMETAKDELCRPGSSVSEVSQRMGYKHPTHFTAAFKKHFGILPSRLSKPNYSL
jgi:AraC-like DNA-binding protein